MTNFHICFRYLLITFRDVPPINTRFLCHSKTVVSSLTAIKWQNIAFSPELSPRARLHWRDVADQVAFKLCMTVHKTVFATKRRTACPSCVRRSPKSPNDSTFVRPAAAHSSCQEYSSTRTAVVRSPWLVRPSGAYSATISASPTSVNPLCTKITDWNDKLFGSAPYSGRLSSIKP